MKAASQTPKFQVGPSLVVVEPGGGLLAIPDQSQNLDRVFGMILIPIEESFDQVSWKKAVCAGDQNGGARQLIPRQVCGVDPVQIFSNDMMSVHLSVHFAKARQAANLPEAWHRTPHLLNWRSAPRQNVPLPSKRSATCSNLTKNEACKDKEASQIFRDKNNTNPHLISLFF